SRVWLCRHGITLLLFHRPDLIGCGVQHDCLERSMRYRLLAIFALSIFSMNLLAVPAPADPKPAEPTEEQLAAAKEAYARFGATYELFTGPKAKTKHVFRLPPMKTDADLKGLPDLPFAFSLSLARTKVTDAGLKELKELKHLTGLDLQ